MQGVSDLCGRGIHVGVALEMVHLLIMGVVSKWVWHSCGCGFIVVSLSGHVVVSEEEVDNATIGDMVTNITVSPGETNPPSH